MRVERKRSRRSNEGREERRREGKGKGRRGRGEGRGEGRRRERFCRRSNHAIHITANLGKKGVKEMRRENEPSLGAAFRVGGGEGLEGTTCPSPCPPRPCPWPRPMTEPTVGWFPLVQLRAPPVSIWTVHDSGDGDLTPVTSSGDLISVVFTGPSGMGGGEGYSRSPLLTAPGRDVGRGDFGPSPFFGDLGEVSASGRDSASSAFLGFSHTLPPSVGSEAGFAPPGVEGFEAGEPFVLSPVVLGRTGESRWGGGGEWAWEPVD